MFYKVSDRNRVKDRIYRIEKINYITRNKNKIHVYYDIWLNELEADTEEEAAEFMDEIHRVLNKKSLFRRIVDFFI